MQFKVVSDKSKPFPTTNFNDDDDDDDDNNNNNNNNNSM
jgi:hypothetical protein